MKQPKKSKNIKQQAVKTATKKTKVALSEKYPLAVFSVKTFLLIGVVVFIINKYENKGYFNPDNKNNHTKRKWDSFYKFTESNNVDVLLLGNSHLYTGINPKNLSEALGVNSFILASPGTSIADSYYSLKEALKVTKPKVVVIETYGMNDSDPYALEGQDLSNQFKSFYARKDFSTKLLSMPYLFKSDNYLYAWYNLFRNHDFLYRDTSQLNRNIQLMKNPPVEKNELYLGRYVRFTKGIENDVLNKYDSLGAPVDGNLHELGDYAKEYSEKIHDLCEQENIELIYLTLPMYYRHVKNYDKWHNKMANVLEPQKEPWIDMQYNYDTLLFDVNAFENSYALNQHMTYNGSLVATYKLKEFIQDSLHIELPNRKEEPLWRNNFYGQEGYFENAPVFANDTKNKLIAKDMTFGVLKVLEFDLLPIEKNPNKMLMAKVKVDKDLTLKQLRGCTLYVAIEVMVNNQKLVTQAQMTYDYLHPNKDYLIFKSFLKPIQVLSLKSAQLNCSL